MSNVIWDTCSAMWYEMIYPASTERRADEPDRHELQQFLLGGVCTHAAATGVHMNGRSATQPPKSQTHAPPPTMNQANRGHNVRKHIRHHLQCTHNDKGAQARHVRKQSAVKREEKSVVDEQDDQVIVICHDVSADRKSKHDRAILYHRMCRLTQGTFQWTFS
jgi:hypothetical protein